LSGGMKRRLSLGISLVGDPKIVFLDEPTTGLDPENKRQIWEILSLCKKNKCMILTTHLMEEAEVLANRIGIITNGKLKCLGNQYKLKRLYGKGFKLLINLININMIDEDIIKMSIEKYAKNRIDKVKDFVNSMFPNTAVIEAYKNTIIFEVNFNFKKDSK
jgi:ABC-type multidrug transport system ATPase subunit